MKRWIRRADNRGSGDFNESPAVDAFLNDIAEVMRKHGLSIGHEDGHGAFTVEKFDEHNLTWLMAAHDETKVTR